MKQFSNFDAFSKHIKKVSSQYKDRESKSLNSIGAYLEKKSQDTIGYLQEGGGSFASWPELKEATKKDKERKGYAFKEDFNPLYRTGHLKKSISHVVNRSSHTVFVGSPLDVALYQEMGTDKIPARSFLGLTFFKEKPQIQYMLGQFLINWITNSRSALKSKT